MTGYFQTISIRSVSYPASAATPRGPSCRSPSMPLIRFSRQIRSGCSADYGRIVATRTTATGQTVLWNAAASLLLTKRGSGELNQALMELGSMICTPRNPKCAMCPLASLCPTCKLGLQNRIPAVRKKTPVEELCEAAVVIERKGLILLRQCGDDERWAGLWDFPRFRLSLAESRTRRTHNAALDSTDRQIIDGVKNQVGVSVASPLHFATLRHAVTRFRITLHGFAAHCKRTPCQGRRRSLSLGETGRACQVSAKCNRPETRPALARTSPSREK